MINICNDKMEGLVTSWTKIQMTYIISFKNTYIINFEYTTNVH